MVREFSYNRLIKMSTADVDSDKVHRRLMTKREAATRYAISERQIDVFRERGMPWISAGPRKILIPIREADAWIEKMMIVRARKPSEYRPRATVVNSTLSNLAAEKATKPVA